MVRKINLNVSAVSGLRYPSYFVGEELEISSKGKEKISFSMSRMLKKSLQASLSYDKLTLTHPGKPGELILINLSGVEWDDGPKQTKETIYWLMEFESEMINESALESVVTALQAAKIRDLQPTLLQLQEADLIGETAPQLLAEIFALRAKLTRKRNR